jgi:hypothetical protein
MVYQEFSLHSVINPQDDLVLLTLRKINFERQNNFIPFYFLDSHLPFMDYCFSQLFSSAY